MPSGVDVFVSYTASDRQWAEWIAWQLEDAGFTTVLQAWDFGAGRDWVHEMQRAASAARRTLTVLSEAYLRSAHAEAEWRAAYAADPSGEHQRLGPARAEAWEPPGLLSSRVVVDLVGLAESTARARLVDAVQAASARAKPSRAPSFPISGSGSRLFPGARVRFRLPRPARYFRGRDIEMRALERLASSDGRAVVT